MSRSSVLIVIGVLTILAPFSGLPSALRTLLTVGLGAVVLGIGVAERSKEQRTLVAAQSAAVTSSESALVPPESPATTPPEPEAPTSISPI